MAFRKLFFGRRLAASDGERGHARPIRRGIAHRAKRARRLNGVLQGQRPEGWGDRIGRPLGLGLDGAGAVGPD